MLGILDSKNYNFFRHYADGIILVEAKYKVPVYITENKYSIPKEITDQLKGAVSKKMITSMKKEAVDCPVAKREIPFLACFVCPSFLNRVKGVVGCAGGEGPNYPPKDASEKNDEKEKEN